MVAYTAITGGYDDVSNRSFLSPDCDYVIFSDQNLIGWGRRDPCGIFTTSRMNAKIHKLLPHIYFPRYKYSLWIDGNIDIAVNPRELLGSIGNADMAMFRHRAPRDFQKEARWCKKLNLDNHDDLDRAVERYNFLESRFPGGRRAKRPFYEASVIFRRHRAVVERFNEIWWAEICYGSSRDQISLPYAISKTGVEIATIPGNIMENDFFHPKRKHKKSEMRK
jgi:hypothetical protein